MNLVAEYKVHELGGSFVIVPYDAAGKPVHGHPLAMSTFNTRSAAETAIAAYVARASRSDRGSSP